MMESAEQEAAEKAEKEKAISTNGIDPNAIISAPRKRRPVIVEDDEPVQKEANQRPKRGISAEKTESSEEHVMGKNENVNR